MRSPSRSLVLLFALLSAGGVRAQTTGPGLVPRPGAIGPTESTLYAAVRARPHDPEARVALGRYLMARGATRVGMTLLEEALRFGGEAARIEPQLAQAYLTVGEFRALAALESAPPGERQRALWFLAHESRTIAPDSIVAVPFRLPVDTESIGRIMVRLDGRAVEATISSSVVGILVADTSALAQRLHNFPGDADRGAVLGAADSLGIGALSMSNVPVTITRVPGGASVVLGLDVLGRFLPTFDPVAGQITLRVGIPDTPRPVGIPFVTWRSTSALQLLQADGWISATRPSIVHMLRGHQWTFDAPRGTLIVHP